MVDVIKRLKELTLNQFGVGDIKKEEALDLFVKLEMLVNDRLSRGFVDKKNINDLITVYAIRIKRLQNTKGIEESYKSTEIDIYKNVIRNLERL